MKKVYVLLGIALIANLYAQVDTLWTRRYTSAGNASDYVYGLAVDNSGNVYVTGGSDYLGTTADLLTMKLNASGDSVWYNVPAKSGSQIARAVAVGNSGNVYITGYTMETGNGNFITIKYRADGSMAWEQLYNGPYTGYDFARKLVIDAQENVYVSGYSQEVGGRYTHATVKYDSAGVLQWARRDSFGGAGSLSYPQDLALDFAGNPYIVSKTATASQGTDYIIAKYNKTNGDTFWVRTYNGTANGADEARAIAFDNSNNVYVTGISAGSGTGNDMMTLKYNSSGVLQWESRYSNPDTVATDAGYWTKVDASGNVYVCGNSYGIGSANSDLIFIKYSTAGAELARTRYNSAGGYDMPVDKDGQKGMALDQSGNVYLLSTSRQIGSTNENDIVMVKYNSAGVFQWESRYNYADSFETAYAIDIDNNGNLYAAGRSTAPNSYYDVVVIKYRQTQSIKDANENGKLTNENYSIFPNPARSYFVVRTPLSVGTMKIFDAAGKIVKVEELNGSKDQRITLDGIKNGIYFIKVGDKSSIQKLIITK